MAEIRADFSKPLGNMKPMHAVNNGPSFRLNDYEGNNLNHVNSNLDRFIEAGFPYARNHDASYCAVYGLEHTVDVDLIFTDFDKDPYDPDSYDFTCTDHYLKCCEIAGTKVFYRLGTRIEHTVKKYHVFPPKDYKKWAVICEHIIRHYTEGWADGFHMDIEYWEIWNEPDLGYETPHKSPTWQGTKEEFFDLYEVAAKHLKEKFPHLKIGGPAIAGRMEWAEEFLSEMQQRNVPIDFFSWHRYAYEIEQVIRRGRTARELLDKYGYNDAESILNEWNYVLEWTGDDFLYTKITHRNEKGASFNAAVMCAMQKEDCDMLMYYDARPTPAWNGLFNDLAVGDVYKGYYPFVMFNTLYKLGTECVSSSDEDLYVNCAKNDDEMALMFTYFDNDDNAPSKDAELIVSGLGEGKFKAEWYLLDKDCDMEKVFEKEICENDFKWRETIKNYSTYLIKIKKI